ncbi:MAG: phenylalanine--tRNA ligase subunit beta [Methyloversatilis sp.]|uniref:phenylalanine--tRNA ligase subunit beta n=1 Tax=Methyloversatilis sp. TaxID=2569862 RepID=UPI0025F39CBB|nr:phenylalanine--tRNA ligase subunit beta [Methyloversatilis sp.]MCR6665803.1 phenylalanine--tRNA ligase subunit beta [Methyloversatilis sp.]
MQFSEKWLRSFVDPEIDTAALSHLLTMAGLEVEELDPAAAAFTSVVVAEVLSVAPHPDADRLRVCQVNAGGEPLQIVCGAPNVAAGMKVPCAIVGAKLPGIDIKRAKLRGVESSGMLCSARELGISEEASGLLALPADAPVGTSIREYLDLDDNVFVIKLTPNRADCFGMTGIAREVAALTGAPLSLPTVASAPVSIADVLPVKVEHADLCGRFSGRVIRGVNARAATPDWMKRRLERAGMRSISVLVDISNYVMLEMNRPNHVFDLDRVQGGLHVRWAKAGEKLVLLNEQTIELTTDCGVIADDAGVESFAGIMGGASTSCTDDTRNVYVEAAFWLPDAIQGRARRYAFSSEAAHRFERGVDFADTVAGVERVSQLILELCGGQAGPVDDQITALPSRDPVRLRPARAARVLGICLSDDQIAALLGRLGLAFTRDGADFIVQPPSWRFDLRIEEDLIEELARLHGYDNIPTVPPVGRLAMPVLPEARRGAFALRHLLADRDYQEVINFAFVERRWESDFAGNDAPVVLANPIASQMSVMRSTLIGGLVDNVATNRRRQTERVRVFEIGRCFAKDAGAQPVAGYAQTLRIAALAWGGDSAEQWGVATRAVDFFDVKADVEALLWPRQATFAVARHPALHPGRSASVSLDGQVIGCIGELHPELVQRYELGSAPVLFELDLEPLLEVPMPAHRTLSRQPSVRRDIALLLPRTTAASAVLDGLRSVAPGIVQEIALFDLYQGKGIADTEKSFAFRILMQDTERTLADAEVDAAVQELVSYAQREFGARLRA